MTRDELGPVASGREVMSGEEITDLPVLQDGIRGFGKWVIKFRISLFPVMRNDTSTPRDEEGEIAHFSFPLFLPSSSFDHASFCPDLLEDAVLADK